MANYIALTFWDLLGASALLFINGVLSIMFRLGLERTLLVNALRMVVQLGAVGFVLKFIFAQTTPIWTVLLAIVMVLAAGRELVVRQSYRFRGWRTYQLGTGTLLLVGLITAFFAVGLLIRPDPWYAPRYILPILGMVLGNTLTGISLGLETLTTTVKRERAAVEAQLALGATREQALRQTVSHALKIGMMPIINAMAATGLISLPGMMSGQILSGIDPVDATKYQILIMFVLAGAVGLGVFLSVLLAARLLSDDRHRLRLDRLVSAQRPRR